MKPFWLEKIEDESGISGVGRVAAGIVFSNGWCAMTWLCIECARMCLYPGPALTQ